MASLKEKTPETEGMSKDINRDEPSKDLIQLQDITHAYDTGASSLPVLHDVSSSIPMGQRTRLRITNWSA